MAFTASDGDLDDAYHLTPPPAREQPSGWMGLQYVSPDRRRSVLMAYRLSQSPAEQGFKLRGLEPNRTYRIRVDGQERASLEGQQLAQSGFAVRLEAEWRAAIVELEAVSQQ